MIIAAATLFLIYVSLAQNLSAAFFRAGLYPAAFLVNKSDGMSAGYLAAVLRDAGSGQPALGFARHALEQTPLSAAALDTVAMATPNLTSQNREALFKLGLAGGWRDVGFQMSLAKTIFDRSDLAGAALHMDAAARVAGMTPALRGLLARLTSSENGRAALAQRLASRPDWRDDYLRDVEGSDAELRNRVDMLRAFQSTSAPATTEEKAGLLTLIAQRLGFGEAYGYWKSLDQPDLRAGVDDPAFRRLRDDGAEAMPFGWRMLPPVVGTDRGSRMAEGEPGLRVSSDGTSAGPLVMQLISLAPGRHQLRAEGVFAKPNDASAFRWSVICWSKRGFSEILQPVSGNAVGSAQMTFDVPAGGECTLQALTLFAQQANMPETAEGWFRSVEIR